MSDARSRPATGPGPGPGPARGPSDALSESLAGRWRWAWLYASAWLVFLVPAAVDGVKDRDRLRGLAGVVLLIGFSVLYIWAWSRVRVRRQAGTLGTWRGRYGVLAAAFALTLADVLLLGQRAMAMTTFVTVLTMLLLPSPYRLALTGAILVVAFGVTELVPGWSHDGGIMVGLVLTAFIMWGIVQMLERNAELRRAHEQLADLAVAEERARFARDLHDLLGHSLTLLAIKAELAGRLVRLDPDRAEAEIAEVERLARDALGDVRAAVGGYRQASLAGELISARAVLDAAGIEAELPTAVDDVTGERRELLGWAVREGVTNVVRHSGASRCRIVVDADGVEILDDGRGPAALPPGQPGTWTLGSGLRGLRERAESAGASVLVDAAPDGGFRLRVGW